MGERCLKGVLFCFVGCEGGAVWSMPSGLRAVQSSITTLISNMIQIGIRRGFWTLPLLLILHNPSQITPLWISIMFSLFFVPSLSLFFCISLLSFCFPLLSFPLPRALIWPEFSSLTRLDLIEVRVQTSLTFHEPEPGQNPNSCL